MRQPKTRPDRVLAAERQLKAFQMRKLGATYEAIAKELGISKQACHNAVVRHLTELQEELREEAKHLRQMEVERLDAMLTPAFKLALSGDLAAMDRVIKISDRKSKLLGLDLDPKYHLAVSSVSPEDLPEGARQISIGLIALPPEKEE